MCSIHKSSKKHSGTLLTGIGADNILSGDNGGLGITLLNSKRTYWSGVLSPYCAWFEGIVEYSPFISNKFVSFLQGVGPEVKNFNNTNKYLLKNLAQLKGLIPKKNIWRKKIRLEQGNETVELFADFLQTSTQSPKRHRFVYEVFKIFF